MVWSEAEVGCNKHPNQRQQPGVCSSCLSERLSKLSGSLNKTAMASSYSSFPSSSSAASSPNMSPIHRRRRRHHKRNASDVLGSISFLTRGSSTGLIKSRSIAFVARSRVGDATSTGKKKGGFWSKFLRSTGKRTKFKFKNCKVFACSPL